MARLLYAFAPGFAMFYVRLPRSSQRYRYILVLAAGVDVPAGVADIFVTNENPTGYSDNLHISMNC